MPSERYVDINETVKEEWREESDSFERVKDVLLTTDYPTTPGNISDQALVNETAAKNILNILII